VIGAISETSFALKVAYALSIGAIAVRWREMIHERDRRTDRQMDGRTGGRTPHDGIASRGKNILTIEFNSTLVYLYRIWNVIEVFIFYVLLSCLLLLYCCHLANKVVYT